jgi:hypothetical protein
MQMDANVSNSHFLLRLAQQLLLFFVEAKPQGAPNTHTLHQYQFTNVGQATSTL